IPVLHKSGRGTDFTYDLSYDNSVWYPVTSGSTTSWQPVQNYGWRGQTEMATGYVSFTFKDASFLHGCYEHTWSNWVYHDPWGIPHAFQGYAFVSGGPKAYCGSPIYFGFGS